jgi:hypothetical protein
MYRRLEAELEEKREKSQETSWSYTQAFGDRMKLRLATVLTVPRSYAASEVERHAAGDYLARALASTGLIVGMQQFAPKQFRHTVGLVRFTIHIDNPP